MIKGSKKQFLVNDKDRFMRIALARLQNRYPFFPQRIAIAAKMYREWVERNSYIKS